MELDNLQRKILRSWGHSPLNRKSSIVGKNKNITQQQQTEASVTDRASGPQLEVQPFQSEVRGWRTKQKKKIKTDYLFVSW